MSVSRNIKTCQNAPSMAFLSNVGYQYLSVLRAVKYWYPAFSKSFQL